MKVPKRQVDIQGGTGCLIIDDINFDHSVKVASIRYLVWIFFETMQICYLSSYLCPLF